MVKTRQRARWGLATLAAGLGFGVWNAVLVTGSGFALSGPALPAAACACIGMVLIWGGGR